MAKLRVRPMRTKVRAQKKATLGVDKVIGQPSAQAREAHEVARWRERLRISDKIFEKWERRFLCRQGWEWYEGYQGAGAYATGDPMNDPYIINLLYPTVEVKIPSLYMRSPIAHVIPRQSREDDPITNVHQRARLREDTVNTFMTDPDMHLKAHTTMSLKESFFYFGLIEVGYDASFIANPNVGKPILEGDKPLQGANGELILHGEYVAEDERVFVKRIRPQDFRVSSRSSFILEHGDWSGYYEWVYADDLKRDPSIEKRNEVGRMGMGRVDPEFTGKIPLDDAEPQDGINVDDIPTKAGMVRIFRGWDHRTKTKFIIPSDRGDFYLQKPTEYEVFPFSPLKFHERSEGFYPMPPHFNLMSPQAELNDTREMQRTHRRRAQRKWQAAKNWTDSKGKEDFQHGGDMTVIEVQTGLPAILPIENPEMDSQAIRNVPQTKEDFMEIAATGSDQRQGAGSGDETATQATIIESRARIRESFWQAGVASWVGDIARKVLQTIEAHMTLPFWIVRNIDPVSPTAMAEAQRVAEVWQEISADELGSLNYDVTVDAESLSPINQEVQNQKLFEFLNIVSKDPILMIMLRASDALLRRSLEAIGIRDEKAVQQVKFAMDIALLAQGGSPPITDEGESAEKGAAAAAATGGGPSGESGGGMGQAPNGQNLPGMTGAVQQLRGQMGLPS